MTLDLKYQFSLLCRYISFDASVKALVIHQSGQYSVVGDFVRFSGDCGTSFLPKSLEAITSCYSTNAGIAPKHP